MMIMHLHKVNEFPPYTDYEAELISFNDEGRTSIDLRLTIDDESQSAYILLMRVNDDGNNYNLLGQINITLDEANRLKGLYHAHP